MSEFNTQQLANARAAAWHQNGEALLTLESARDWLDRFGLVLYTPRPLQIPAPAASLVEAALGTSNQFPSLAETEQARDLAVRLVAEGAAVPLNLLGTVGDQPDFIVSVKLFSFLFTLRGDKAWKQPPSTVGVIHVSQLALNAYQLLMERGELTTPELVHELGREVTEAAVLRALCELWGNLRVLPVMQPAGAPSKWEPATRRFTKQIKAGVNAGLPTALSALISVYLGQAIVATEEEIEVFLSPLMARSRIREVSHALLGARQLETVVLEGKTLLHVTGELPEFAPIEVVAPETGDAPATDSAAPAATAGTEQPSAEPAAAQPRIRKFEGRSERERRPFQREASPRSTFTKPWEEGKPARTERAEGDRPKFRGKSDGGWKPARGLSDAPRSAESSGEARPPRREFSDRPRFDAGDRPRRSFGDKPKFAGGDRPRRTFGDKPKFGAKPFRKFEKPEGAAGEGGAPPFRREGEGRPPRREFGDRSKFAGGEGRPPRRDFGDKPKFAGGDRPRRSFGDKPKFGAKPFRKFEKPEGAAGEGAARPFRREGEGRPPRRDFGDRPKFAGGGDRPRRTFGDKPKFGSGDRPSRSFGDKPKFGAKPFRKFEKPEGATGEGRPPRRDFGDRPKFAGGGDRPRRTFGDKPKFDSGDRPRRSFGDKPKFGAKPFRKFEKPEGAAGEGRPPRRDFGDKPKFAGGDRPRRSFGDKPQFGAKPFRKFAKPEGASADGEKKPFRKPGFTGGKPGGFKKTFGDKPKFGGGKKFGGKPAGKFGARKPAPRKPKGDA